MFGLKVVPKDSEFASRDSEFSALHQIPLKDAPRDSEFSAPRQRPIGSLILRALMEMGHPPQAIAVTA